LFVGSEPYNNVNEGPIIAPKKHTGIIVQTNSNVFSFQSRSDQSDSFQVALAVFKSIYSDFSSPRTKNLKRYSFTSGS
jgi:hypothetical protein